MPDLIDFQDDLFFDFLRFPQAEALAPVNPQRWPRFVAEAAYFDPELANVGRAAQNLQVAFEYLDSSHNRTHLTERGLEVLKDTAIVNSLAELGGIAGPTAAAKYSNKAADRYAEKIVRDLHEALQRNNSNAINLQARQFMPEAGLLGGVGARGQHFNITKNMYKPPKSSSSRPGWTRRLFHRNPTGLNGPGLNATNTTSVTPPFSFIYWGNMRGGITHSGNFVIEIVMPRKVKHYLIPLLNSPVGTVGMIFLYGGSILMLIRVLNQRFPIAAVYTKKASKRIKSYFHKSGQKLEGKRQRFRVRRRKIKQKIRGWVKSENS